MSIIACKHPKEKVREETYSIPPLGGIMCSVEVKTGIFRCQCGVIVKPKYKEINMAHHKPSTTKKSGNGSKRK